MNIKTHQILLGDIPVEVVRKNIKNLHLSVHPPDGKVRISAPARMSLDAVRLFAATKLGWIKKHQAKLRGQQREAPRDFVTRESHCYLGKRYLLNVVEVRGKSVVILKHDTIELHVPTGATRRKKSTVMQEWYRERLKEIVPQYVTKWEPLMNVNVAQFGIKRMKTKWGTCNRQARRIWINLDLAKKPEELIEYIVVHEMAHILERNHGARFVALLDGFLPQWRSLKVELNRFPVSHAEWGY